MKSNDGNRRKRGLLSAAAVILAAATMIGGCSGSGSGDDRQTKPEKTEAAGKTEPSDNTTMAKIKPEDVGHAMLEQKFAAIYSQFSAEFKQQLSEQDFASLGEQFTQGVDSFDPVSSMRLNGIDKRGWLTPQGDRGIQAVFDTNENILGLQMQYFEPQPERDNQLTKTEFDWPFHGDYFVYWGGNNPFINYHYAHESQQYAYDLSQVKDGMSYTGDAASNESYFAFGQDILAPADGTVVTVVNDIADNSPVGVMNEKEPLGNVVIIDHGNGEYSYLAHLKQGTATVQKGDQVKRGDVIGKLGNSGNSSEPHLHFQVSDGADLYESKSLPVRWKDGSRPVQGETVSGS
ncbi:peptidoglycan DD-metalloendopeptidase family protein [Paenibacillus sp. GCM10027626]|uniref:peptidoglycan DD-metalloendopeptidase family protein n=1 Tax=Paenibacillus sp. GCM10027626 TaxID=3273411 RepID=UPI00362A7CBA